jgi:hypothetical protein
MVANGTTRTFRDVRDGAASCRNPTFKPTLCAHRACRRSYLVLRSGASKCFALELPHEATHAADAARILGHRGQLGGYSLKERRAPRGLQRLGGVHHAVCASPSGGVTGRLS